MPDIYAIQSVLNKGELSPKLQARVDSPYYRSGLARCENFYPLVQGGVTKRTGTSWIKEALRLNNTTPGRMIPFVFSETESYVLEFGHYGMHVLTQGGYVGGSTPTTFSTPYHVYDIWELDFVQSADVIYFTHEDYPVYKLERRSETDWVFVKFEPTGGPFMPINKEGNYCTFIGIDMPFNSASSLYDQNMETGSRNKSAKGHTIEIGWNGIVAGYWIQHGRTSKDDYEDEPKVLGEAPRNWVFEGRIPGTTSSYVTLDARVGEADWTQNELRAYYFDNDTVYSRYRLRITANNGAKRTSVYGFNLYVKKRSGYAAFQNKEGINDGAGFTNDDVGRLVRVQGSDGFWRTMQSTNRRSSQSLNGLWEGFFEYGTLRTDTWQLGSFCKATGYPKACTIYQERLTFGSTKAQPRTLFMSQSGDYENFSIPDPLTDEAPITVTIAGAQQDRIQWLREVEELCLIGTTDGVASVGGANEEAVSATNIKQRKHTGFGVAPDVHPVRAGAVMLFPGFHRKTLHELNYSTQNDGYEAPSLAILADHLYQGRIRQMAFSQVPHDLVYILLDDGTVTVLTYERAQQVVGHSRIVTDGIVKSIAVVPEDGVDALYMIVRRTADDTHRFWVERLSDPTDYSTDEKAYRYLDSHIVYDGTETTAIAGLDHLEGRDVQLYGWLDDGAGVQNTPTFPADDALTQKLYRVIGGQIELDFPVSYAVVGLPYNAILETLPHMIDASDGSTFGRIQKIDSVIMSVQNTSALAVQAIRENESDPDGDNLLPEDVIMRKASDNMDEYLPRYTGEVIVPVEGTWEGRGRLRVASVHPHPATVRSITLVLDREPGLSRRQGG